MSTTTPRSLVIGLDGVPHWLLKELADDGVMPQVAKMLPEGSLRALRAPVPEISSTSWASFLTGADPGSHGIFGFVDLVPGSYDTYFPNLAHVRVPPLWTATESAGLKALVLNVPGTFPAPPLDGTLVAGFVAPNFDRAVYPPRHRERLRALGYQLDVEVGDPQNDPHGFLDRVDAALDARLATFRMLLHEEPWSLAICVFTETDRVHHFLWQDLRDPGSPLHERLLDFYSRVDQAVGEIVDLVDDAAISMVSDHGFGGVDTQFHLNAWLRQAGYLALGTDAEDLSRLDGRTRAFAMDPGRIYLHESPRWPRGSRASHGLREEIARRVATLRLNASGEVVENGVGRLVAAEVLRGEELYDGSSAGLAPDLVVMPGTGIQIRGAIGADEPVLPGPFTGTHTKDDALFWTQGDQGTSPVAMRDVAPTLLATLDLPPLSTMEGVDVRELRSHAPSREGRAS